MLSKNQIISILLLAFLFSAIILFLTQFFRKLHFNSRIQRHLLTLDTDNEAILDQLFIILKKRRNHLAHYLMKYRISALFYAKNYLEEKSYYSKLLATKLLLSSFFVVIYFLLVMVTLAPLHTAFGVLSFLIGFILPDICFMIKKKNYKKQIKSDLLKAITLMRHSFQVEKSTIQAVEAVYQELEGPLKKEFYQINQDMIHGLSLEKAFTRFQKRIPLKEIEYITTSLSISEEVGNDMVLLFSSLETKFYKKISLEKELSVMISNSKLVYYGFMILPLFIGFGLFLANPDYFTIFLESSFGILLLAIISLYLLYILVIYQMIRIDKD